jgi:DNA-binding TFAR19-related protein (PDSD5 family)
MSQNNKDNEQYELDKIRMKKMKALMEAQKRKEASQKQIMSLWEKVDYILKVVLMPDAYTRLSNLKTNEPSVYQRVINELISADVIQNIDYLMWM